MNILQDKVKRIFNTRSNTEFPITKLTNLKQLPSSASIFLPIHRRTLNVKYMDCNNVDDILNPIQDIDINKYKYLHVNNLTKEELKIIGDNEKYLDKVNDNKEKTLALYLYDVIQNDPLIIGIKENLTDDFVCYLLTELEFNQYPFKLRLQYDYSFRVFNKQVIAKIEFSIEKKNGVVFFSEDKHLHGVSSSTEYGESQIAAEVLACAYNNYDKADSPSRGKDQIIYNTRIIGTRFTFYMAFVSANYLKSLNDGFPQGDNEVTILRFPPQSQEHFMGYDYANENERPIIIELLLRLREQTRNL